MDDELFEELVGAGVPPRVANAFARHAVEIGATTLRDLRDTPDNELLGIRMVGPTMVAAIRRAIGPATRQIAPLPAFRRRLNRPIARI